MLLYRSFRNGIPEKPIAQIDENRFCLIVHDEEATDGMSYYRSKFIIIDTNQKKIIQECKFSSMENAL